MRYMATIIIFLLLFCSDALAAPSLRDISNRFTPLFNRGQYDKIISEAGSMLEMLGLDDIDARMGCYLFLADAWFATGDKEKARKYLAMAVETNPAHMAPYFMEARLKTMEGHAEEAYSQCRENSLKLDPAQGRALVRDCLEMMLKSRTVEAYKLWQDFKDDENAATSTYGGSLIAVRGKVTNVTQNVDGNLAVTLSVGADKDGAIKCGFPGASAENPNLVKGRILLISGLCRGMVEQKYVLMSGCAVIGGGPARLH